MVESEGLFLVKSSQEKERGKKKSSNCSPLNIPENFTGLIDRKGKKLYKTFLPLRAI